jgi:serine/threonine protein kinase
MTKSRSAVLEYTTALKYAHQEATMMYDLCTRHLLSDYVTEVYGFAEGPLPDDVIARVRLPAGDEGFCMVMRYEAGGSLEGLLYGRNLGMKEKLRLLTQIARAVAELHAVGVVHGDLKVPHGTCVFYRVFLLITLSVPSFPPWKLQPANFLLEDDSLSHVRVADFGMSDMKLVSEKILGQSVLQVGS